MAEHRFHLWWNCWARAASFNGFGYILKPENQNYRSNRKPPKYGLAHRHPHPHSPFSLSKTPNTNPTSRQTNIRDDKPARSSKLKLTPDADTIWGARRRPTWVYVYFTPGANEARNQSASTVRFSWVPRRLGFRWWWWFWWHSNKALHLPVHLPLHLPPH